MKKSFLVILLLFIAVNFTMSQNYAYTNGNWFDGKTFSKKVFYSVNGTLTEKKPSRIDSTLDLNNRFVIPPFGDAHHHGIDSEDGIDQKISAFLSAGVFYVKNPNVIPELLTPNLRSKINIPTGIDVTFSNGGLTSPNGHPVGVHRFLLMRGTFKGLQTNDLEGKAYFTIASESELNEKWPAIIQAKPDFIKTFLLFSEEYDKRKDQNGPGVMKGLDPEVLKKIVAKAHENKLRVTTHIETTQDFRNAIEAGVDEINHLPIPRSEFSQDLSAYVLDEQIAKKAAAGNTTIVATVTRRFKGPGGMKTYSTEEERNNLISNQMKNLQTLYNQGVRIAIGSDGFSGENPILTGVDEAMFMHENKFFDNLTLLKIMTENTAQAIYPDRKIGALKQGFEASFLVLEENPLDDFESIRKINLRIKQGQVVIL